MSALVETFLAILCVYLAIGLVVGIPFIVFGVEMIDPAAVSGTWGFRLLILPGCLLFWPCLLKRWHHQLPPPTERSNHRAV